MISPLTAVFTRLTGSAWRAALVAGLIASGFELYNLEMAG